MRLLRTSSSPERLEEEFESSEEIELEGVAPEVMEGKSGLRSEVDLSEFDSVFMELPVSNPIFGRVVLEIMEETGLEANHAPLGFYITAKKNYLYYVMEQRNIPSPKTVVAGSEKAGKNVLKHLETPIVARRYEDNSIVESKLLEGGEEVEEFAEGTDYGKEILIYQKKLEGDKYKVFYADGNMIPLKDKTEGWRVSDEKLQYSSLSTDLEETVVESMRSIGAVYGEVVLIGNDIVDIRPNPDPQVYADKSGKDAFGYIREIYG